MHGSNNAYTYGREWHKTDTSGMEWWNLTTNPMAKICNDGNL